MSDEGDTLTDKMKNSNTVDALNEIEENSEESLLLIRNFDINDLRDLQILIDQPQKHVTPFETYVSYRIMLKTTRNEFEKSEYMVRRRYSDFEWLRQQLRHLYPSHIVPPLPEKHSLFEQIDRYDRGFIQSRMQLLGRFLNRIADHPVLSCDKLYKAFLTELPTDFTILKKNESGLGLFGRMSESLQNMTTAYVKGRTVEFERMHEYLSRFREKIITMEKIGQRVHRERSAYLQDALQIQGILNEWSDKDPDISNTLRAIGEASALCAESQIESNDNLKLKLSMPLHEYGLYTEAAKDALSHRDASQIDYEVHMEQLCRVKAEQTQLETSPSSEHPVMFGFNIWRSPEQVQQQRIQQLESASNTLSQQVETSRDKMECSNENLRADFERWNQIKADDVKDILIEMADLHIQLYEQSIASWSRALSLIKK